MRIAVISDLHANREALEATWKDLGRREYDRLVCTGDIVGYGPDPAFCVDFVREHCEWSLMGNHDDALFSGASDFNPYARGAVDEHRRALEPRWYTGSARRERWEYLRELPLTKTVDRYLFCHGSPRDPVREYVISTDGLLNRDKLADIFELFDEVAVAGHTHQPGIHDESFSWHSVGGRETYTVDLPPGSKAFVNAGSVGQPRDGDPRACYCILEPDKVTWYRVEYDVRRTQEKILQNPRLDDFLARRLSVGK
ncbi:phosphodiesterase [Planctomycetes bacterium Pla163]|uniref:Phosphodiesterase n=1 Tax=Rohdeia mirabilis TaxID=2528008 RepID=A0A518D2L3_9BACT|nr:phosphodiesterase [Planctomycetes bacterium Pla163]